MQIQILRQTVSVSVSVKSTVTFPQDLSYCVGFGLGQACSTNKVINQKLRSAKIMRGKQFSIRGGVGESDLVFAQVWTVYEVIPVKQNEKY